jgi:hypothetical protein
MATISGVIFRSGGKERIPYATIKATQQGQPVIYTTAGEGGEFAMELPVAGKWSLVVLESGSLASQPQEVDADQDLQKVNIYLDRLAGTPDEKAGTLFFWLLVGALFLLIGVYILLHQLIVPSATEGVAFWVDIPLRYLEILFWGLFGILVSKIITIGWYLRKHRYYREGKIMHLSHIFTTPILVLVVVLLLSTVNLTFTLAADNTVNISLSEPAIMVAFAFMIGTLPWPLWNYIRHSAEQFMSRNE